MHHTFGLAYLFFSQFAVGGTYALLFSPPEKTVGTGYYQMNAGLYLVMGVIGMSLAVPNGTSDLVAAFAFDSWQDRSLASFAITLVCLFIYNIPLWMGGPSTHRSGPLILSAVTGTLSLIAAGLSYRAPGSSPWIGVLLPFNFVIAALSLGTVLTGMLLGHWYLVRPRMAITAFRRFVAVLGFSLLAQAAVLGTGLLASYYGGHPDVIIPLVTRFTFQAICFWSRIGIGIVGTIVLAGLTWHILKTPTATQPATGVLYVAVVWVLIGELAGRFLLLATQLPL
ncbi:MAG: hypothetical protein HY710_13930 [Candidatus Latescibacteria bacterium]|nr:hypothetical protein [Candidatus Latescibacterota bacterium]